MLLTSQPAFLQFTDRWAQQATSQFPPYLPLYSYRTYLNTDLLWNQTQTMPFNILHCRTTKMVLPHRYNPNAGSYYHPPPHVSFPVTHHQFPCPASTPYLHSVSNVYLFTMPPVFSTILFLTVIISGRLLRDFCFSVSIKTRGFWQCAVLWLIIRSGTWGWWRGWLCPCHYLKIWALMTIC